MIPVRRVLLVLVAVAHPAHSRADFKDGNDLRAGLAKWRSSAVDSSDLISGPLAAGYVMGVHDAHDGIMFCTPRLNGGITVEQLTSVVLKSLEDNPEEWHEAASPLVSAALTKAFPCKKPKKP